MSPDKIPQIDLREQHRVLRDELLAAVGAVFDGAQFILGPPVGALEQRVAARMGCAHGVGLNSGTDAIVLALAALDVGPGDEVITTPFTFVSTVEMIVEIGARAVLVDVEPDTLNIDPAAVARAVSARTKVIMPVHLYGQSADLTRLAALAAERGLAVVEDAAQAIGAAHHGRPVGSWGRASCLSFFPTKNLGGCGDAGMLVTPEAALADRVRMLRSHGQREKYRYLVRGRNSRLDTLQAAILLAKLEHLDRWNEARRAHARRYGELLAGLPLALPVERPENRHVYHQYTIRVRRRDEVRRLLSEAGIGTAVHYPIPLHLQPAWKGLGYGEGDLPVAEQAAREVLSLPLYPELTPAGVERVAAALAEVTRSLGLEGEGAPA